MESLSILDKKNAISLYKSGLSAQQVADTLHVGIKRIYTILRRGSIPRRSPKESNRIRFEGTSLSYAVKTALIREEEDLKLAAIMLYWAEGYKIGNGVDFANSDPATAVIFIKFLREICGVRENKLRAYLYCYEGQDIRAIRNFWSNALSLPENQFTKPYIKAAMPGERGPRMPYGLVHVRYYDKKLLRQILDWIDEYCQKCVGTQAVNEVWL